MKTLLERAHLARRAGRVNRYHQHTLLRSENVAEHTFGLLNLLMVMTDQQITAKLLLAAIKHDMGEYVSGDIPSPVKHNLPVEGQMYIDALEDFGVTEIHANEEGLSEWEALLLKSCDLLDGLLKCVEEKRMGNYTIESIGEKYAEMLNAKLSELGGGPAAELVQLALTEWHWSHK